MDELAVNTLQSPASPSSSRDGGLLGEGVGKQASTLYLGSAWPGGHRGDPGLCSGSPQSSGREGGRAEQAHSVAARGWSPLKRQAEGCGRPSTWLEDPRSPSWRRKDFR